jgi:hypothetical protein
VAAGRPAAPRSTSSSAPTSRSSWSRPNRSAPRPDRSGACFIPLKGTDASSRPVANGLLPLVTADVELVVLHVFTSDTTPRVLDRPARDLQMLGGEFIARYCPNAARVELRGGTIDAQVADVCQQEQADLIVLSWSRDISAGRAAVIRWALGHSTVPVLLLPVDDARVGVLSTAAADRLAP